MSSGQLLTISGSLRAGSFNRKLLAEAARLFDPETRVDADLRLPLYDGDVETEHGIPPEVQRLSDQIADADAVVISGPEYNKGPSGVLKNALDWISRTEGNPWQDKPLAILSATAGRAGGERTQFALRLMMVAFRPRLVQGPEVLIGNASRLFDEEDRLTDEFGIRLLTELMAGLRAEAGLAA